MGLSLYRRHLYRRHFIASGFITALAGISPGLALSAAGQKSRVEKAKIILVLGDSLSAEYGLKRGTGWVALLEKKLKSEQRPVTLINASISGDTTSGGRARLDALLTKHRPTHVIIELGGNDALRGLPLSLTQDNLAHMTQSAQATGARVLLLGMQVPPNYGKDYAAQFAAMFVGVAKTHKAALVPFMLKGIADRPDSLALFQADRIHPKEEAHPLILANVWPELQKLLK
jgi:acyl-CoA thioesterase-1